MRVNVLNRLVVAVGIGAVALFGMGVTISAQPQQDQKKQDKQQQQAQKKQAQAKPQPKRLAQQDQQKLIDQQQQRLTQYRGQLDQQQRVAQQQTAQLQQQKRTAQYNVQQQYQAQLNQQRSRIQTQGNYNYRSDPHFTTAPSYRYSRGGQYYQTSQAGADLLRQAVNYGYEQGVRAGMADRQDRWGSNYQNAYAYQDANYGYGGFYVDRADYNTYFREGFRRGYQDGYNGRYQYGTYVNGRGTILGAIAATILNFQSIR
ncbi:MAG: hypothetical protein NT151_05980 [Acidobacteria bacterium]|nr:hypothetical protein [Acidobacteriota bacterium]